MTNVDPGQRRARLITTSEGKFINVNDIRLALNDPAFVQQCAMMIVVGHKFKADPHEIVRRTIGCAVMILAGDEPSATARLKASTEKEEPPTA